MTNGLLKDFDAIDLMNKVKTRGESLFTSREHGDMIYDISIHFEDIIGVISNDTEYYIDIVSEDKDGHQERLTTYKEHSHLKDYQVVGKLFEFKYKILSN